MITEKIKQHIQLLDVIGKGISLTKYADNEEVPMHLRKEGISQREQYLSMLTNVIRDIKLAIKEK